MAAAIRPTHSKPFLRVMLCSAFVFFCPHAILPPAKMWFTNASLASDSAGTLSEAITWCDDDDYHYVKISQNEKSPTTVNPAHNAHFDATGVIWELGTTSIVIRIMNKLCWNGGIISGDASPNIGTDIMNVGRPPAAAMQIFGYGRNAEVEIRGARFFNVARSVDVQGRVTNFTLANSWLYDVSDDCIGGTLYRSWIIEDSLLDGCGIIVRTSAVEEESGKDHVLRIRNNVIRIATKRRSASARRFANESLADHMRNLILEVHGNVFLVEDNDAHPFFEGLRTANLTECSDNVVVWLGAGEYPEWLPDCFSITDDSDVWEQARSSWIHNHQLLEGFHGPLTQLSGAMESHRWHPQGSVRSEGGSNAQSSVQSASRRDHALAGLEPSTLRTLAVPRRTRRAEVGSPWSDGTLWNDGTGWTDYWRGSLVSCRESQAGVLRPMTGATVCSP